MSYDLTQAAADVLAFNAARDWARYHDPKSLALAIASEAGELCHLYRWHSCREADTTAPVTAALAADEIADLLIFIIAFCDRCGIDPAVAVERKLAGNVWRHPLAEPVA